MNLKSKMSLDISNVTKNLGKVASSTRSLAVNLAGAFVESSDSVRNLNNQIRDTAKIEGISTGEAAKELGALEQLLSTSFNGIKERTVDILKGSFSGLAEGARALKQDMAMDGSLSTLATHVGIVGETTKKALVYVYGLASTLGTKIVDGAHVASGAFRTLITSAIKPLAAAVYGISVGFDRLSSTLKGVLYTGNKSAEELLYTTKKTGMQFKDVGRIVQGILISKIFYSGLNMIRRTKNEVWEFAKSLEYSKMVYSNMFQDASLSDEFVSVLQDFAANVRFSFSELNDASQQLVAYGFKAENLMYVLQGVSAAASITGDPQKMESISRALGQIGTKGRLMGEELRQLAEAGIPAYEILQEKLGLSYKQMQNLGDEAIPANVAINALIDGINERFGGLLEQTNTTMAGMVSNIKDIALQISADIFSPFYESIKKFVGKFGDGLKSLYDVYKATGIGGLFEELVPEGLRGSIKTLIAGIITLFYNLYRIASNALKVLRNAAPTLLTWLNALATTVNLVVGTLSGLLDFVGSNSTALNGLTKVLLVCTAAWIGYKVAALSAAATVALTKVLDGIALSAAKLSRTLIMLAQHPLLLMGVILVTGLLAASGAFDKVRLSIERLLSKANGVDGSKLLQPKEMEQSTNSIDKFSQKLGDASANMDSLADSTKKANNNAMSFDEIYTIGPDEENEGILDQWEKFIKDIKAGKFDPSTILSDVNVEDFAGPFVGSLIEEFSKAMGDVGSSFTKILENSGLEAIIAGAIAGIAFGHPWAGVAVGLATYFWGDIKEAIIDLTPNPQEWATDINAALDNLANGLMATLILKAFKVPLKVSMIPTVVFAAISFADIVTAWLEDTLGLSSSDGTDKMTYKLGAFEIIFGQLNFQWPVIDLSGLFGNNGAMAQAANMGINGFVAYLGGWLVTKISDTMSELYNDPATPEWGRKIIEAIRGGVSGAVAGGLVGSWLPVFGTLVGAIIGGLVGAFGETAGWDQVKQAFVENLNAIFNFDTTQELFNNMVENFKAAFTWDEDSTFGQNLMSIGENIVKGILNGFAATFYLLTEPVWDFFYLVIETFGNVFNMHSPSRDPEIRGIGKNIMLGILDGMSFGFASFFDKIDEWKNSLVGKFGEWKDAVVEKATGFQEGFEEKVSEFTKNTKENINDWWSGTGGVKERFTDFKDGTSKIVADWWTAPGGMKDRFDDFSDGTKETIADWWSGTGGIKDKFNDFKDGTKDTVSEWWAGAGGVKEKFGDFKDSTKETVADWWSGTGGIKDKFGDFKDGTSTTLSEWLEDAKKYFGDFKDGTSDTVDTWRSDPAGAEKNIEDFATNSQEKVAGWLNGANGMLALFATFAAETGSSIGTWSADIETKFGSFTSSTLGTVGGWASDIARKVGNALSGAWDKVRGLQSDADSTISSVSASVEGAWESIRDLPSKVNEAIERSNAPAFVPGSPYNMPELPKMPGHSYGGVFDREHVAKFAEKNKREAIIPLENDTAMQPFVDAVSDGITRALAPTLLSVTSNSGGGNSLPPMYVGTLIADDRGLKELQRKLDVISISERVRRGELNG